MTTTETPTSTAPAHGGKPGRAVNVTLWVLQVLLAAQMALSAVMKLAGDEAAIELFTAIGWGQWFRYFTGAVELAGAIGLLIPRLSGLAAAGLVATMVGAVLTHVFVIGGSSVAPIILGVIALLIAIGRRDRTAELVRLVTNR